MQLCLYLWLCVLCAGLNGIVESDSASLPGAGYGRLDYSMGASGQAVSKHPGWSGYQRQGEVVDDKKRRKEPRGCHKKGSRVAEPSRATSRATQDGLATAGWALLRYAGNNVQ